MRNTKRNAGIILFAMLLVPCCISAQEKDADAAKREVMKHFNGIVLPSETTGRCPNCNSIMERYFEKTDRKCPPNLAKTSHCSPDGYIMEDGYRCTNAKCGLKYSAHNHVCEVYGPGQPKKCLYVERVTMEKNSDFEMLRVTNNCVLFFAIKFEVRYRGTVLDSGILIPGDTYQKAHPRNSTFVAVKRVRSSVSDAQLGK